MTRRSRGRTLRAAAGVGLACLAILSYPARVAAQTVVNPTEQISFTRPEAWALKYFASATLLGGLDAPRTTRTGSVTFGLELEGLPTLSQAERRVGYDGTKVEDLNKSPIFFRPRVSVGLPDHFSLIVAGDPPIRTFGLRPKLLAVGLERPVYEGNSWSIGLRGYGQVGTVEGAYTCPASVLRFVPGSPQNFSGCQAASSDVATLRFVGGELMAAYRPHALRRLSPHAALGVNYLDIGFQVNALTFGYIDHTHLLAHGTTVSPSAGVAMPLTAKLGASVDVAYVPLSVRRAAGAPLGQDSFLTARVLVTYKLW